MVKRTTTIVLSQPAYEAATMKIAGPTAATKTKIQLEFHKKDCNTDQPTKNCEELSGIRDTKNFPVDEDITKVARGQRYDPHSQVWKRREQTVGLDGESQDVVHVFRQIGNHDIESPIVTDLSGDQGKHRCICHNCFPWSW